MPESLGFVAVVVGFGLLAVTGAWLGAGYRSLGGLITGMRPDPWPRGVQEPDAPHFAVEHADALRPDAQLMTIERDGDDAGQDRGPREPEIVELYSRPIDRHV